jgi:hypothetical protein
MGTEDAQYIAHGDARFLPGSTAHTTQETAP